jgi:hypothetical protein
MATTRDAKIKNDEEYFNIKALCRALIIILENPIRQLKPHFKRQLVPSREPGRRSPRNVT